MNLQHEKIENLCEKLKLQGISQDYLKLSDEAAKEESTYTHFLAKILDAEKEDEKYEKTKDFDSFCRISNN